MGAPYGLLSMQRCTCKTMGAPYGLLMSHDTAQFCLKVLIESYWVGCAFRGTCVAVCIRSKLPEVKFAVQVFFSICALQ